MVERADRAIKPEMDSGNGRGLKHFDTEQIGNPGDQGVGEQSVDAIERDGQNHEVSSQRRARAKDHFPQGAILVAIDCADTRRQADLDAMPRSHSSRREP